MDELSSPAVQASFKRIMRVTLTAKIIMAILTLVSGAFAIWMATKVRRFKMDWSEITFIVLLSISCLCFIGMFIWTAVTNRPYSTLLHRYVKNNFYSNQKFLGDVNAIIAANGVAEFTIMLAGDKLTVFMSGTAQVISFDITPVKKYPGVCVSVIAYIKQFLLAYCATNAATATTDVKICDSVAGKAKITRRRVTENGAVSETLKSNYYIKKNLLV